jgi:dTDP-4-amino-4,6-dideoxygalactose transaminase
VREIGGYFQIEVNSGGPFEIKEGVFLNSARSCLELILREEKIRKVYMPAYICNSMLAPVNRLDIEYEFYDITLDFKPVFEKVLDEDELIIIVNYFGVFLNDDVTGVFGKGHILIDNAQNFFGQSTDQNNVYTVYSPRKFFGVIDGGILKNYFNAKSDFNKCEESALIEILKPHLLRFEYGNNPDTYTHFAAKELKYYNKICSVSNLTKALLSTMDFNNVKEKRVRNFNYLHDNLNDISLIPIERLKSNEQVPMIYPFFVENNRDIYTKMIREKIYCPYYWRDVLDREDDFAISKRVTKSLVALPIDQRYDTEDMQYILYHLKKYGYK